MADLPWVITIGSLGDDEDWEPVVCGPYERPHALALAQAVVADEDLMAVVEPLLPLADAEAIRDEIELARGGEPSDDRGRRRGRRTATAERGRARRVRPTATSRAGRPDRCRPAGRRIAAAGCAGPDAAAGIVVAVVITRRWAVFLIAVGVWTWVIWPRFGAGDL